MREPTTYGNAETPRADSADPRVEALARAMWAERVGGSGTMPVANLSWDELRARGGESGGVYGLYRAQAAVILPVVDATASTGA